MSHAYEKVPLCQEKLQESADSAINETQLQRISRAGEDIAISYLTLLIWCHFTCRSFLPRAT